MLFLIDRKSLQVFWQLQFRFTLAIEVFEIFEIIATYIVWLAWRLVIVRKNISLSRTFVGQLCKQLFKQRCGLFVNKSQTDQSATRIWSHEVTTHGTGRAPRHPRKHFLHTLLSHDFFLIFIKSCRFPIKFQSLKQKYNLVFVRFPKKCLYIFDISEKQWFRFFKFWKSIYFTRRFVWQFSKKSEI